MIDWNLAPEGAVAIKQDCGKWKKVIWIHADGSWWNDNDAEWNPEYDESKWVQTIAVRPVTQTKTVADAEQEGEKWTHTYSDYGVRKDCILIHDKPDDYGQVLVLNRRGEYVLTDNVKLKPIKSTLSESDAKALELFANKSHRHGVAWAVKEYLDDHDII